MDKKIKLSNPNYGTVYADGSMKLAENGKVFSKEKMQKIKDAYKGANRIHKPLALLFYTDVMNGKGKEKYV
ncbi:MAG: hypothetical protein ACR2NF_12275 [Pirellulales bacterium]